MLKVFLISSGVLPAHRDSIASTHARHRELVSTTWNATILIIMLLWSVYMQNIYPLLEMLPSIVFRFHSHVLCMQFAPLIMLATVRHPRSSSDLMFR